MVGGQASIAQCSRDAQGGRLLERGAGDEDVIEEAQRHLDGGCVRHRAVVRACKPPCSHTCSPLRSALTILPFSTSPTKGLNTTWGGVPVSDAVLEGGCAYAVAQPRRRTTLKVTVYSAAPSSG